MKTRLYFFTCGTLKSEKHLFTLNKDVGLPFEVPVPFFLIQHKGRNILFDTGNALEVAKNPQEHWGDVAKIYYPVMSEEQYATNQLQKIGIAPDKIDFVILSHLHLDHAGAVGELPNAVYLVHEQEKEWAFDPECTQKAAYIMKDISKKANWQLLSNKFTEPFDLFGDGVIEVYPTPGHTPGHQSLLVKLADTSFFITSDSCYTEENLHEMIPPGLVWNADKSLRTVNWIRDIQKERNLTVVTGHDPQAWDRFEKLLLTIHDSVFLTILLCYFARK